MKLANQLVKDIKQVLLFHSRMRDSIDGHRVRILLPSFEKKFSPSCPSSLSCINEYLAIDNDYYISHLS